MKHRLGTLNVMDFNTESIKYINIFSDKDEKPISNAETKMILHKIADCKIPITINNAEYNSSYVCSPYTGIIPYCKEELYKINNNVVKKIVNILINIFGKYFKNSNINKVVQINNWMLSTNILHYNLDINAFIKMKKDILMKYPGHAILIRSLNGYQHQNLISELKKKGFLMAPSRQVYIFNDKSEIYSHNDIKNDLRIKRKNQFEYVDEKSFSDLDIKRAVYLYRQLYIDKYSQHNPQFTYAYFKSIKENDQFELYGYRDRTEKKELQAIGVRFYIHDQVTLPIVGYNLSRPKKEGLYRLIMLNTIEFSYKRGFIFNASSGAPHFKEQRGAQPYIEYTAIYSKHLPKKQKQMWKRLNRVLLMVMQPILVKFKL